MTPFVSQTCHVGPLRLHTLNYERNECIWCGPNCLARQPGRWVDLGNGKSAWSASRSDNTELPSS